MSLTEFLSLAEQKKTELQTALEVCLLTIIVMSKHPCARLCMKMQIWYENCFILPLQRLESSCPLGSLDEVSAVVELLQESSQWFPGGSKQMKVFVIPYRERAGFGGGGGGGGDKGGNLLPLKMVLPP